MKKFLLLAVCCLSLLTTGCLVAPVIPPQGLFYSSLSAPIDTGVDGTPVSSKSGESHSTAILCLVAWGDASTATAAKEGGLTKIDHVDYKFFNVLGIYQKFTLVAHGE